MPDLELVETWAEINGAITTMDLKKCSFLGLVQKSLFTITNKKMLSADSALEMISRIAVQSPHNMFEKCALVDCYELIKKMMIVLLI